MGTSDGAGDESGARSRRRIALLALVLALVVAGAGVGTFVLGGSDTAPGAGTATPVPGPTDGVPPVTPTAVSSTPTTGGTPTPTPTPAPPVTPGPSGNVSLAFLDDGTLLRTKDVVPGASGISRRAIRNEGETVGSLSVVDVAVADSENGVVGPESEVDDSPDAGELSRHLQVRLTVEYPNGETVSVFGDGEFVPLSEVVAANRTLGDGLDPGATATLVFEWRLPAETGNEVQSDAVSFDVVFRIRASEGA